MDRSLPAGGSMLDGRRLRFILSAGRTGTVFLAQSLASGAAGIVACHEPWPARWELVLANFRNRTGIGGGALRSIFRGARRARLRHLAPSQAMVEVNPLLCPLADLVGSEVAQLTVVHLVREPLAWAKSMVNFRAAGWRRPLIHLVPFAIPYPPRRPQRWRELEPLERALWRWRYCNEQIAMLEPRAASYRVLRYEDLFAGEATVRARAYAALWEALGLSALAAGELPDVRQRVNAYRGRQQDAAVVAPDVVREICGPWLTRFGYDAH